MRNNRNIVFKDVFCKLIFNTGKGLNFGPCMLSDVKMILENEEF